VRLGGLVKNSTLDYPGLLSAVLFTQGCNFTCPYCHNPHLIRPFGQPLAEEAVLDFLRGRRKYLDGVVISGGEPCLQPDLTEFCKKLQGLGYAVKLDSNGSNPELLADLIERRLINYAALDLKADPRAYPAEIAPRDQGRLVLESLNILKRSALPHEFRTTVAAPFVDAQSLGAIARAAVGPAPLYLQPYRPNLVLDPDFMSRYPQPSLERLGEYRALAGKYLPAIIRA
jgi:pyruvate formate lyase activating enzyme